MAQAGPFPASVRALPVPAQHPVTAQVNGTAAGAPPVPRRPPRFEHTHQRITSYLENALYDEVHDLRQQGKVASITALLNAAVRDFLARHYR